MATWRDAKLKAGAKPDNVGLDLAVISHLYTIATKESNLPVENPCAKIRKPSAGQGRDVRMSHGQEAAIITEAAKINAELPAWIILAVETGMRRGELAGLRREWITGRVVKLPDTKNGMARSVPLSKRSVALLSSLPVRLDGAVFGMDHDWVTKAFAAAAGRAGFPDIRFHDIRHEATSRLFVRGLSMMEVATIVGHKTLSMLRRYAHLNADDLAAKLG